MVDKRQEIKNFDLKLFIIPRSGQVIVEGETTGHRHRLLQGSVLEDAQAALFLEVGKAAQVIHQEHHSIELPAGCYRVNPGEKLVYKVS